MVIRKLFHAEAAHRVALAYTTRCRGLHGHSYIFEIFLRGEGQDEAQMLIDFKIVKEKFNRLLDALDHSILIWDEDKDLMERGPSLNDRYMILPYNTTAEQIARHIYQQGIRLGFLMHKVVVHETATGYAEFSGDDDIQVDLDRVVFSEAIQKEWR